ncbi:tetratricopeptide repeat protein [Candidatus Methylocalor cossyra]|uniref:Tetratricopeptide repeat-containing protein n=1 Tax=Candidatus Methylocalor cossyra TaxID=3108543 RepID=A0ABM9NLA2_9GAMM
MLPRISTDHCRKVPFRLLVTVTLLIQMACVGTTRRVYQYPSVRERTPPTPTQPEAPAPKAPAPPSEGGVPGGGAPSASSPAVVALRNDAQADLRNGNFDNAAASLERAIRIQPRNPMLWHDLAQVRLQQGQPGLAEDLAKKSNLHAQGQAALIRANWSIIAEARRRKGDAEGAAEAERKAAQ